ncbi:MAG: peptidoglycan-binding protein [Rhodovibrio sp.]|nr:peptidoglycan-binding protein [Rhodovibrio sp.]
MSRPPETGDQPAAAGDPTAASGPVPRDPFLNRPLPDLFFAAQPHRAAWTFLRRSLRRGLPFVLLTGDFGAGKTMLTLRLVRAIRDRGLGPCVHMSTPAQGAAPVLRRAATEAGLDPANLPGDAAGLARALHDHLIADPPDQRMFLVLEDPQDMDAEALERLLQAVPPARDGRAALTAVLIGHGSLTRQLQRARFRRFDARIRARHHLRPMDAQQTRAYVDFRLSQAAEGGRQSDLPAFDDAALDRVFELTRGNPREINNVCGISLGQAVARQRSEVDRDLVDAAARALGRSVPPAGGRAPVVVPFPGGARGTREARGCPDYVHANGQPARQLVPPPGPQPSPEPTADAAHRRPVAEQPTAKPAWRTDSRVRIAAAGVALMLAAAYLAAPYLTPDDSQGTPADTGGAAQASLSASERREVEALLRSLDFETGPVDGRFDPTTLDAVQAYKNMAGMTPADRQVGPALLEDLRAVTGNLGRSAPEPGAEAGPP